VDLGYTRTCWLTTGKSQEKICPQGATDAKLCITSLNSHFPHQKPQHKMMRRKMRSKGLRIFLV